MAEVNYPKLLPDVVFHGPRSKIQFLAGVLTDRGEEVKRNDNPIRPEIIIFEL